MFPASIMLETLKSFRHKQDPQRVYSGVRTLINEIFQFDDVSYAPSDATSTLVLRLKSYVKPNFQGTARNQNIKG